MPDCKACTINRTNLRVFWHVNNAIQQESPNNPPTIIPTLLVAFEEKLIADENTPCALRMRWKKYMGLNPGITLENSVTTSIRQGQVLIQIKQLAT
jgi:hypothetical protein